MNRKGFTLVELLAVIVILGIVLAISIPNIFNIITITKEEALDIDAASIARELDSLSLLKKIDIDTFTKEDLDKVGIDSSKYEGFGVSKVNGKVVVTLVKDNYIGENKLGSKVYGVRYDGTGRDLTRTDDAVGLMTTVSETNITSDFDNAEIYSEFSQETDTYGNVFIKIPKFWIKKTNEGAVWIYQISRTKQDSSYYLPACFYDETSGKIVSYVLVGKYEASLGAGDKLESKSDKTVQVSKKISEFRTYAKNNNILGEIEGYQQMDVHVVDILQTLFYVEFATFHGQSIMAGFTNTGNTAKLKTGTTDSVGSPLSSGSTTSNTDGKSAMKYRGIENVWGNTWTFIDGINMNNNQAYVSRNAAAYESDIYDGDYVSLSYKNHTGDGWIKTMGYDPNNPFIQLPTSVAGSGDSPYFDYYYQVTGKMAVIFGGYWIYGSSSGLSCWSAYGTDTTGTGHGARLVKVPL